MDHYRVIEKGTNEDGISFIVLEDEQGNRQTMLSKADLIRAYGVEFQLFLDAVKDKHPDTDDKIEAQDDTH